MGRAAPLSLDEKKLLFNLSKMGHSFSYMVRAIGRSRTVIKNYVNSPHMYEIKKSPGRPSTISDRDRRRLLRKASNSSLTARQINAEAVCKAISKNLGPKYLFLSKNQTEMRNKVSGFENKFGMTQVFGCINGTHIPIRRPLTNSQDFFCYKQYFFLSVQAVCDYKGYFMDVECMWPGSVHDAKVFANSSINMKLRNAILPQTFQKPTKKAEKIPNYLIGDPAYPLLLFCIKEYEHCSDNEEVIFNNMLRAARNSIECAFGRLKARWGILTRKVNLKLEAVPTVTYACFVLHNICKKTNSYVDDDLAKS
ncbi:putative nuclease HARBI1 [Hydra vulgaris]|uniref:Nuclease HARBI1 n=1 Tax=Hydra vulgaris TaxID=6087 RepID=A0ABM4DM00_HYDVU